MPERWVSVRDGRFQTSTLELGSGEPLLYLHGSWPAELADGGGTFVRELAERWRVVAPFHPGFGASTGNEQLVDLYDLLYYYLDFLDALDLHGLPLVGHSLGGMIAAELAALQPQRFTKLVLIGPLGLWNAAHPVPDFFTFGPEQLAEVLYHDQSLPQAAATTKAPGEGEALINWHLERAQSLATSAKYLWPIPNRGLSRRLHRARMPTLLVWGEHDGISPPAYAADFEALLPNSRVVRLSNAAHQAQVEQPRQLAETIQIFLTSD